MIFNVLGYHGYFYDYRETKSGNVKDDNVFICPIHGRFIMQTQRHYRGANCQKCKVELIKKKLSYTTEQFIKKLKNKYHDNNLIFSRVNYINLTTPIELECPICGYIWETTPQSLLVGSGCPKCGINSRAEKRRMKKEDFINKAEKVHGKGRYSYEKSIILGYDYETEIYCTKCNRYFKQIAGNHLQGKGCPYCSESRLETFVRNILEEKNIDYIYEARFKWIGRQTIDFYLPKFNIGIECQGEPHFKKVNSNNFFNYDNAVERDTRKHNLCNENNLGLFYLITDRINLQEKINEDNRLSNIYNDRNVLYKEKFVDFIDKLFD